MLIFCQHVFHKATIKVGDRYTYRNKIKNKDEDEDKTKAWGWDWGCLSWNFISLQRGFECRCLKTVLSPYLVDPTCEP